MRVREGDDRGEKGRSKGDDELHLMQCWQPGPGNCQGPLGQAIVALKEEKPVASCHTYTAYLTLGGRSLMLTSRDTDEMQRI